MRCVRPEIQISVHALLEPERVDRFGVPNPCFVKRDAFRALRSRPIIFHHALGPRLLAVFGSAAVEFVHALAVFERFQHSFPIRLVRVQIHAGGADLRTVCRGVQYGEALFGAPCVPFDGIHRPAVEVRYNHIRVKRKRCAADVRFLRQQQTTCDTARLGVCALRQRGNRVFDGHGVRRGRGLNQGKKVLLPAVHHRVRFRRRQATAEKQHCGKNDG